MADSKPLEFPAQSRYVVTLVCSDFFETMSKKMKVDADKETKPAAAPAPAAGPVLPALATLTAEQITELKERAAKADENWDRFLRQAADLENYKKRAARERSEAVAFANEALLQKLVPILDTFEMALAAATPDPAAKPDPAAQSLRAGIVMVSNQLKSTLAEAGLEEIDATDKTFDPAIHQAVSQKETAKVPEGRVVQQIRKGYKFRNRLLRPAGVIVAKKPAP